MDGVAITAILAGLGTIIGIFLKYISGRDKSQQITDDVFATALLANTNAMKSVAAATTKQAKEAEKRNGHLAEIATSNNEINLKNQEAILNAITNISKQHISKQSVKEQVIEHSTVRE